MVQASGIKGQEQKFYSTFDINLPFQPLNCGAEEKKEKYKEELAFRLSRLLPSLTSSFLLSDCFLHYAHASPSISECVYLSQWRSDVYFYAQNYF